MKYPTGGTGQEFVKATAGTHVAVCISSVDVGLQPGNPKFAGVIDKEGKPDSRGLPCPTIYLRFEIPAERITYQKNGADVEGPITIWWNGRASMNEKATLRKAATALSGKAMTEQEAEMFDIDTMVGRSCMIQVVHSEDGKYANVKNFMPLPKGMPAPKAENPLLIYNIEKDSKYDALPKFLRDKVDNQLLDAKPEKPNADQQAEDAFADAEAARQDDPDDEIPFN